MKLKLLAASTMLTSGLLLSGLAVAADGRDAIPATQQSALISKLDFKPIASITNDDALSASTGGGFKGAVTTYENDGNENTTTRAGLRVRKSSVVVALQHNLAIDVANHLTDSAKFISAVNKILPAQDALKEEDLADLDTVVITASAGSKDVITDLVPDSINNPIVDLDVQFTLTAKPGKTIGAMHVQNLVLAGQTKVKLTDYRRVNQSTIKTSQTAVHVTVKDKQEAGAKSITYGKLAQALDGYFDITAPSFATPLFPIWNIDPATHQPMFIDKASGEPVKHSLNREQINTLAAMYTGLNGTGSGDFGKARIERAVQKVVFVPAQGKPDTGKITKSGGAYTGNFDVTITFIQHWSWNNDAYTDRQADFTLNDVPVKVTFKK